MVALKIETRNKFHIFHTSASLDAVKPAGSEWYTLYD